MTIQLGEHNLDFFDCVEVGQGGPEACSLVVDGWLIEKRKFDPSPLPFDDLILIPMRKISFFKSGYALTLIDPRGQTIKTISKVHGYMKLLRVDARQIEFATSAYGDSTAFCSI
jgi:hypothetical protein